MMTTAFRIGHGFDVHRIATGRKLVLCGVEIDFDGKGLIGHSDADVACHALIDALLGAVALGDIGQNFPDTDERYRDISSLSLLADVIAKISSAGYRFENADITIIAEAPRLSPYIEKMRKTLSKTLSASVDAISIKATTTEGLGFTGRGEGIGATAVALVTRVATS